MVELLTSREVSEALKVTEATLADWRYRGRGPRFVKLGRLVRYRTEDVHQWLSDSQRRNTGAP